MTNAYLNRSQGQQVRRAREAQESAEAALERHRHEMAERERRAVIEQQWQEQEEGDLHEVLRDVLQTAEFATQGDDPFTMTIDEASRHRATDVLANLLVSAYDLGATHRKENQDGDQELH